MMASIFRLKRQMPLTKALAAIILCALGEARPHWEFAAELVGRFAKLTEAFDRPKAAVLQPMWA